MQVSGARRAPPPWRRASTPDEQGFFLGMQMTAAPDAQPGTRTSSIYVNYPAAYKFRGDWVMVRAQNGRRVELEDPYRPTADPVKRAAVEACERIMSWFLNSPTHTFIEIVERVVDERRQHDIADCILQVSGARSAPLP